MNGVLNAQVSVAFDTMWAELAPVGRQARGGYRRFAWTGADATLREWFTAAATRRGLDCVTDRAGNLWAWWGDPDADGPGVVTGSHLDSVPGGGGYDGPLGVISAFAAIDDLRARGWTPSRPIGVVAFVDEEGARFGLACAGSRLLTGALSPDDALKLTDADGTSMADAMRAAGHDPAAAGPDAEAMGRVGTFVELHIEQGRALVDLGHAVGVASAIWPHGRWRVTLTGEANHAGTTALADRSDPMLDLASLIQAARSAATRHGALATVGKIEVEPNGVNAIPSEVRAWLDCRAADEPAVRAVLAELDGFAPAPESWTSRTAFDAELAGRLAAAVGQDGAPGALAPILDTGAGHDAGVLAAAGVPTAMLFVRNPSGVSHSPAEFAEPADCHAGVSALVRVLEELAG